MSQPAINALLNGISAVFLVAAFVAARRRNIDLHWRLIVAALVSSALFLVSYLDYHYTQGHTTCVATGVVRTLYFLLLIPHVLLAALMVPLIAVTVHLGARRRPGHRRLARITLPIWLYVSVTGVLLYLVVHRIFADRGWFVPPDAGDPAPIPAAHGTP